MTDASQQDQNQKKSSWHQSLTKGTLAEAICVRHFSAAGWSVSQTGIERLIPDFAQRNRWEDQSNAVRIQKYIGLFPDLLVKKPNPEQDYHYLVEVKFRNFIATPEKLDEFVVKMLWQYRNLLFGDYEKALFPSISPNGWLESADNKNPESVKIPDGFQCDLKKLPQQKGAGIPKLPLLFYIVTPSVRSGLCVHLACPDFSKDTGFTMHSLHDASREAKADNSDEGIGHIVTGLRGAWENHIQPALDHMFPGKPSLADKEAFTAVLRRCVERVIARTPNNRKGAYIEDILKDAEYWKTLESLDIEKCHSPDEVRNLLEKYHISPTSYHYIYLSSLPKP